jgi:hypothetical protein
LEYNNKGDKMNKTSKAELVTVMEEYGEMKAKLTAQFFDTDTMTREDFIIGIATINQSAESFLANWEEA